MFLITQSTPSMFSNLLEIQMIMRSTARVEVRLASGTSTVAPQVLGNAHLTEAFAAEYDITWLPFGFGPHLALMSS